MKFKIAVVFLLLLFITSAAFSQGFKNPFQEPEQNSLMGGVGVTFIDGDPYTTLTLAPDFAFGKFGIGIYLQLLMDNNNSFKLRKDEYKGGAGILRAIRYVRYGRKYDPFYARIGSIEGATLANGFLMWNYNNASNYDKRKIGLVLDVDMGTFGFESVTSNLNHMELVGANVYFRPFRLSQNPLPILKNFRLYTTYVRDNKLKYGADESEKDLSALGLGADLMWLNLPLVKSSIYFDYGKIIDYGNGQATGINLIFPEFIGIFGLAANFEKRFLGDQFMPNLFGPMYDLERELYADPLYYLGSRIEYLKNAKKTEGYFGQLVGHVIHKIRLTGNYQKLNGVKNSGVVHLEALAPDLVPKFELRAYYDKAGIETFKDFRTLDSRSIAAAEVGYRLNSFIVVSTIYRWYWIEDENGDFKPIERVEPRVSFSYQF
ncbi:MAG: hypothetical protein Kow0037_18170 [Calditrichia bacterium]